jgi:hypothetical protein
VSSGLLSSEFVEQHLGAGKQSGRAAFSAPISDRAGGELERGQPTLERQIRVAAKSPVFGWSTHTGPGTFDLQRNRQESNTTSSPHNLCFFILVSFIPTRRGICAQQTAPLEPPGNPPHLYPYQTSRPALKSGTPAIIHRLPPSLVLPAPNPNPQTARVAPDDERKLKFGSSSLAAFAPEHLSTGATEVVVVD